MSYTLYIGIRQDFEKLRSVFERITGVSTYFIDELELVSGDFLILMVNEYFEGDFPIGVVVLESKNFYLNISELVLAQKIALDIKAEVAVSVPKGKPDWDDPFCWLLIMPGGQVEKVYEDMRFVDNIGLFLNRPGEHYFHE